jgi:Na+/alanine symporter
MTTRNIYSVTCLFLRTNYKFVLNTQHIITFFTTNITLLLLHYITHCTYNVVYIVMCKYLSTACCINLVSLALLRLHRIGHTRDLPNNCTVPC